MKLLIKAPFSGLFYFSDRRGNRAPAIYLLPYALSPMRYALCPMLFALCAMLYALCPMLFALCSSIVS